MYFWNSEDFLHLKAMVTIKKKILREVILLKAKTLHLKAKQNIGKYLQ